MVTLLHGDSHDLLKTLPDNSVDAVVTDPPYGLSKEPDVVEVLTHWLNGEDYKHRGGGFMGKSWDSFVPGPALWREVFRVLKPGGHALVFAGTRTVDLMGISLRLAGFEIRDYLEWVYATGFPKSHNVSKAIDKHEREERQQQALSPSESAFCEWMRDHSGLTAKDTQRLVGSDRFITGKIEIVNTATSENPRLGRRSMVPTAKAWKSLKAAITVEIPDWVEELVKDPPKPGIQHPGEWKAGKGQGTVGENAWAGWGTALKPAHEPIIVARKPLEGTVAQNVLKWGTGAINIDGCRIGYNTPSGRWPANFILSHHEDCEETGERTEQVAKNVAFTDRAQADGWGTKRPVTENVEVTSPVFSCAPGCPVAELDRQSGVRPGGASRFFFVAKPSKKERNAGLEGFEVKRPDDRTATGMGTFEQKGVQPQRNSHPTVKPIQLMRYLCRLITPPGGTVLDPFVGSGTTGCAAVLEGFGFIGMEQDAEYLEIAKARIAHWTPDDKSEQEPTGPRPEAQPTLFDDDTPDP